MEMRPLTYNEKQYINEKINKKKSFQKSGHLIISLFLLFPCTIIIIYLFIILKKQMYPLLLFLLIPIALIIIGLHFLKELKKTAALTEIDDTDEAVTISGKFSKKWIDALLGIKQYQYYFIGNTSVELPSHWIKYMKLEKKVDAKIYVFTTIIDQEKNTVIGTHPMSVALSANGKLSIDKEVGCGLLEINNNIYSLILIGALVASLIFGLLFLTNDKIPKNIVEIFRYVVLLFLVLAVVFLPPSVFYFLANRKIMKKIKELYN